MKSWLGLMLLAMPLLAACADGNPFQSNQARADAAARSSTPPLGGTRFAAGHFDLQGYYRQGNPADSRLAVFIEGDGVAYITRYQRAFDPTPEKPIGLDLAAKHPWPNVLYLARPCQYVGGDKARNCASAYWTSHRFAPEVITSMNEAIDQYLRRFGPRRITLYGYSGGAMVALLLAASRQDVDGVVTVSGVLDHDAWTNYFPEDTPLFGSRNSLELADQLRRLPQRHFVGARDKSVPPELATAFIQRLGLPPGRMITRLNEADHECCWARLWPELAQHPPVKP